MASFFLRIQVMLQTGLLGVRDEASDRGATAVEYGLLVALIAAVIVGIVATLGGQVAAAFSTVSAGF